MTVQPLPAPLWTSAHSKGDRHASESVIGLSELVIGIVGIRTESRPHEGRRALFQWPEV